MSSVDETAPLQKEERKSYFILIHITAIVRTWGLITAAVLWVSAIFLTDNRRRDFIVFYVIAIAVFVSFFEITWVLNKCACCGQDGCCCRLWRGIMWVDNWKKFLLYVFASVPLFLEGKKEALAIVSGFMLIILSSLYLIKTFQGSNITVTRHTRIEKSQVITGTSVSRQVVTHESSTQTPVNEQTGSSNPFEND